MATRVPASPVAAQLDITMDVLARIIQRDPSRTVLFADELDLCEESRLEVEQQLDSWREILEGIGLRISRTKTEYVRSTGSSEEVCFSSDNNTMQQKQQRQPDNVGQMSITQ